MENSSILTTDPQPGSSTGKTLLIGGGVVLLLALSYGIYGLVSAVIDARQQANSMVVVLHDEMAKQNWDQIYITASKGYQAALDQQKSQLIFSSLYKKLGAPTSTSQQHIKISATTSGRFITAIFTTNFSQGDTGTEIIVWRQEDDGQYRLFNYNVQSEALLTR